MRRRLFTHLIDRPVVSLIAITIGTALLAIGTIFLKIEFSPDQVYVGRHDEVEFSESHKEQFRFEDSLVLVLLQDTSDESLMRPDCLHWSRQFADQAAELPSIRNVTSLTTLRRPRINLNVPDGLEWTPLLPENFDSDQELLQDRLKRLPLLNDLLISSDQSLLLTLIDLEPSQRQVALATEHIQHIEAILKALPSPKGTRTLITGVPAIRVDVIRSIMADQFQMVPVCSGLFLLVSLLIFRSPLVTGLSLLCVLSAVAWTIGLMGWCGSTFSVMSNVIPTLILIIAAANSVHIVSRFQGICLKLLTADSQTASRVATLNADQAESTGNQVKVSAAEDEIYRSAVLQTMQEMSGTCFLTLATTAVGFGSLAVAQADVLKAMAFQASSGMFASYCTLMLIMPATLWLCRRSLFQISRHVTATNEASASDFANRWSQFVIRRGKLITVIMIAIAAASVWWCTDMRINSYLFETYSSDHPTMRAVRLMDDRMSGMVSLEVQLQADDASRFLDTDVVVALRRIQDRIDGDDRICFYRDYVQFVAEFDQGRLLRADHESIPKAVRRLNLILAKLKNDGITSAFVGRDQPVARIMMRLRDIGSANMKELFGELQIILQEELPSDVRFRMTGDAWLHAVCMDVFVRDLFLSLVTASVVIFLLISLLFRSIRTGLISAIPNLFPLIMTVAWMKWNGYELTAGNVIVFAIGLGIAVDDTIHFLSRFRDEQRQRSVADALHHTLVSSGKAIVLTTILVVSGLSVLVFSQFLPTVRFAELTAITMLTALPGDLLLLPAMLSFLRADQRKLSEDR